MVKRETKCRSVQVSKREEKGIGIDIGIGGIMLTRGRKSIHTLKNGIKKLWRQLRCARIPKGIGGEGGGMVGVGVVMVMLVL